MSWYPHVTVAAIVEREGRFLMVKEAPDGEEVFNQPAGHLEEGETLLEAVVRETLEETGWHFTPKGLVGIYRWQVPPDGATYLRFCFHGEAADALPSAELDTDIIEALWLTHEQLNSYHHQMRSPLVLHCIDDYLSGNSAPLSSIKNII